MILSNVKTPRRSPAPVISKRKKVGNKARIYHFHNGSGGGVLSVIRNLLEFSQNPEIENHVIFTINKEKIPEYEVPVLKGAVSESVFYYSPNWNFYHTCKALAKLLPDDKAVIVAHDWLELGMCSNLGLQNPVVQVLHGDFDYYYDLSKKHSEIVDKFISVSSTIYNRLLSDIPGRKKDIFYRRFPVPSRKRNPSYSKMITLLYCVDDLNSERKQFELLPQINKILQSRNIKVSWIIIGGGMNETEVKRRMSQEEFVKVCGKVSNSEVLEFMIKGDLILLPSLAEGLPVVVVEGMKCGLVPLVTDWNGATRELIIEGESGFYFTVGNAEGYAERIAILDKDSEQLKSISNRAMTLANELFDPVENTQKVEQVFFEAAQHARHKEKKRVYGSRLDREWIPNAIVKLLR